MIPQTLFGSYGGALLIVDSADFDGTSDYMTRGAGLTGAADSKTGIFSCWIRLDGGDGASQLMLDSVTTVGGSLIRFRVTRFSDNKFAVTGVNASNTTILDIVSTTTYTASSTWLHLLSSWNLGTAGARSLYVNDVDDLTVNTFTDDTLDYTFADWACGADAAGNFKVNGCLAELYFAPGQYLDFSLIGNRRKFISSSGKPIVLGADGSIPTGTAPLVYFHLDDGEAVADFATNRATGGDFSITGTLTTGSTSPSD